MNCYHCELPVLETGWELPLEGKTQHFCCGGCLAVAEHLHTQGLTQYYQIRQSPGIKPDEASVDEQDMALLESRFTITISADESRIELAVEGITCGGCAWLIEHALDRLEGVSLSLVNLAEHRVRVHFQPAKINLAQLIQTLADAGYRASPWAASKQAIAAKKKRQSDLTRLIIAGIGAMQAMMFAVALYASDGNFIEYHHEQLFRWISLTVSIPVMLYSAVPFYRGAYTALKARRINMDVPVSTALIIAWLSSLLHVLQGSGEVYFDSVSMFAFFLLAGRFLEASMQRRALSAGGLDRLPLPTLMTRVDERGHRERLDVDRLQVGDQLLWQAGEYLAVDAVIYEGEGQISQALLTGESDAIAVMPGQTVLAGALNGATPLWIRVTATGENRAVAQLENRSAQAQKERPRALRWAERWSGRFVVFQLLTAGGSYLTWLALDPSKAFEIGLAVLVATCPCAFALAAPTALAAARAGGHRLGMVLLSPNALERLAQVNRTVTDKTGTLTLGRPIIVQTLCEPTEQSFYESIAAGLEQGMSHPLARPFSEFQALSLSQVQAFQGKGIQGEYNAQVWRLGSPTWQSLDAPEGHGWLALTENNQLKAWFQLSDPDRPGLPVALGQLPQPIHVLSGDSPAAVKDFCQRHGLPGQGGLSPEQKLEKLMSGDPAHTLALGDGINDAPLLARAGASIALTDASALTRTQCDALVISQDLRSIPHVLTLARKTKQIIRQNLAWAIGYNASVLPLAMVGWLPAWGAALGMSLSSLLVVFNALRLRNPEGLGSWTSS